MTGARQPGAVRRAAAHEIPEIEAVAVAAYAEYRTEVPAPVFDAYLDDLRRLADHWRDAEVLVAEVEGSIAGSVLFYPDAGSEGLGLPSDWAGFRKLAVRPEMRGRGLGRVLTEACIAAARAARGADARDPHDAVHAGRPPHVRGDRLPALPGVRHRNRGHGPRRRPRRSRGHRLPAGPDLSDRRACAPRVGEPP